MKIDTSLVYIDSKVYIIPTISVCDKYLHGTYEINITWLSWDFVISFDITYES